MTYSCADFTDSILDALKIDLSAHNTDGSDDIFDSPSMQADLALAEIERLQKADADLTRIRVGAQPERDKLFYIVWATRYRVTAVFVTDADANAFMEKNPGHGVIATVGPFILIANVKDEGEKVA